MNVKNYGKWMPILMQVNNQLYRLVYFLSEGRVIFTKEFMIDVEAKKGKLIGFKSMISGSYFGETEILCNISR